MDAAPRWGVSAPDELNREHLKVLIRGENKRGPWVLRVGQRQFWEWWSIERTGMIFGKTFRLVLVIAISFAGIALPMLFGMGLPRAERLTMFILGLSTALFLILAVFFTLKFHDERVQKRRLALKNEFLIRHRDVHRDLKQHVTAEEIGLPHQCAERYIHRVLLPPGIKNAREFDAFVGKAGVPR